MYKPFFLFSLLTLNLCLILIGIPLVTEGTFFDALLYSSISRNMAELGSPFWSPSYLFHDIKVYYEHPPLHFWLQSYFFVVFGDHLWVDRVFSFVVFSLSLLILCRIWSLVTETINESPRLLWLPCFIWITTPIISWSYPFTMLENTLTLFTVLSALLFLEYKRTSCRPLFLLYILTIVGAFLTKGPVGLFPLMLPLLYGICFTPEYGKKYFLEFCLSWFIFVSIICGICVLNNEAYLFLKQYFNQQVFASLSGARESKQSPWTPLFGIVKQTIVTFLLGLLVIQDRKNLFVKMWEGVEHRKIFLFLLSIALSASLPLVISPKQRLFYLIPSLFFYALSLAALFLPGVALRQRSMESRPGINIKISRILMVMTLVILVFLGMMGGRVRRDHEAIEVTQYIKNLVSSNETLDMLPEPDWTLINYLQRYYKITTNIGPSLTSNILITPRSYKPDASYRLLFFNNKWNVFTRESDNKNN